ncbi:MAG: ATPase [Methanoregula sp.]|uniref:ATPase n=1 Tax=Methanoregula sp. TaxID=2052170 RepID=UPI003BAF050D
MVMIEKMNGQMEAFIPEKVIVSAIKSGAPLNIARDIAEQISGDIHDGMTTQDIKVQLLLLLKSRNPEWEQNWFSWRYGSEQVSDAIIGQDIISDDVIPSIVQ